VIIVTPYLVNPVDASEIKLPTDGYLNPNMLQQVFGNMENAGKSGGDRPKPSAAPGSNSGGPKVGELENSAIVPTQGNQERSKKRKTRSADAKDAAPGFSM
jgi:pilus assembly protein CpaC